MRTIYTPPSFKETAFHCALCHAYSRQIWSSTAYWEKGWHRLDSCDICLCEHCKKISIWYEDTMVYPDFKGVEPPNLDLNEDIQRDYQEAASILQRSPRGSAALLRLAIQKLCIELTGGEKDLNTSIASLVSRGLPLSVQKSLDAVRVIGNEAVHPGQMDLCDDVLTASALFRLVNIIAEKIITEPKTVEEIYSSLPETKRREIEKRDSMAADSKTVIPTV